MTDRANRRSDYLILPYAQQEQKRFARILFVF